MDWCKYLLILTVLVIRAKGSAINSRIVNGQTSRSGQFPYQALIIAKTLDGQSLCGGSLISQQFVLTAAHCAVSAINFEIHLGAQSFGDYTEAGRVIISTDQAIVHEEYFPLLLANDIALIRLTEKVNFTDQIQSISLQTEDDPLVGQTVIATGWGLQSSAALRPATELQYANLEVIRNEDCARVFSSFIIRSSTVCAQGKSHESTCSGDSGGPLVLESSNVLVGVTSFGVGFGCDYGFPGGFSRVSSYAQWIKSKIEKYTIY